MTTETLVELPAAHPGRDRRILWLLATVGGVAVGMVYPLSPMSLWFVVLAIGLAAWSGRGLSGGERRAVVGLVAFSLAARALAVALFFLATDHDQHLFGILIGDEKLIQWRSMWIRNIAMGVSISPEGWANLFQAYGETGLVYVFAYMHALFGPSPYGAHLVNVLLFVGGAVVLHRMVRASYGGAPAFGGLMLVLCLPSLFAWSISTLKEPAYFFLTSVACSSTLTVLRGRRWTTRLLALLLALVAIDAVSTIRSTGRVISIGGFGLGVAARLATLRAWLCLVCILVVVVVGIKVLPRPDVQAQILSQFRVAAVSHIGNVMTEGYSYKLLDPHFYSRWAQQNDLSFMTLEESARYAMRAALSVVLVPLPWQLVSGSALVFLPEQMLWYLCLVLACVGVIEGLRRDAWLTFLLVGYCVVAGAVISLPSGNIGTFIRMRDMFVPFVLWLSALGGCVVLHQALEWFAPPIATINRLPLENPAYDTAR